MTGWTYPEVYDLLLSEVVELFSYWKGHPPIHQMIAAYLQIKPPAPYLQGTDEEEEEDQWWETIEEENKGQELGGFLSQIHSKGYPHPIKIKN